MSIDKEGSGLPQVNVHRRTSKVNISMVAAILVFFAVAAAVAFWVSRRESGRSFEAAPASLGE